MWCLGLQAIKAWPQGTLSHLRLIDGVSWNLSTPSGYADIYIDGDCDGFYTQYTFKPLKVIYSYIHTEPFNA
jgi:hypothetical protein